MTKRKKKKPVMKVLKPAKSKQKKTTGPKLTFPQGEFGPDHLQKLKEGLNNQYTNEVSAMLNMMFSIQEMIGTKLQVLHSKKEEVKEEDVMNMPHEEIQKLFRAHIQVDRSVMIEQVVLLDSFIEQALYNHKSVKLHKSPDEISNYTLTEDGLDNCLQDKQLSKEFERERNNIKNFRALKDQFARFPSGAFVFPAEQTGFKAFLNKLEGIEIQDSIACKIDGKEGIILPYRITSGKYIDKCYHGSIKFYQMLLDILFPGEDKKGKKSGEKKTAPEKGNSKAALKRVK